MSYIVIFKPESLEKKRLYLAKIFKTLDEAKIEQNQLEINGHNGEKVIHINIEEGRK